VTLSATIDFGGPLNESGFDDGAVVLYMLEKRPSWKWMALTKRPMVLVPWVYSSSSVSFYHGMSYAGLFLAKEVDTYFTYTCGLVFCFMSEFFQERSDFMLIV
jgi:hypothetical protein